MKISRSLSILSGVAAVVLGTAGCAARQSSLDVLNAQAPVEYRGHYTRDDAGSWFRPCGSAASDSAWWVTVTDTAVGQLERARQAGRFVEGRPSFVRWRAVLTRGGEVGPRGATALLVREILVVRAPSPDDCVVP